MTIQDKTTTKTIPIKPRTTDGARGGAADAANLLCREPLLALEPKRPLEVIQIDEDFEVLVPAP
ncbi:MAG: hypothetical protein H0T92_14755 [Pyrinomonadaceae bacterium]|nr:hypothetical protein [Pyrinomonadaceae bacterium]